MNILTGVKNFLELINENWTIIVVIIGLIIGLVQRISKYMNTTTEEKVEIAKSSIKEVILKWVSDAEDDYAEWVKAGSIKRSQVIKEIFIEYPILSKVTNQEELINWIDKQIDDSLDTLREIIKENNK